MSQFLLTYVKVDLTLSAIALVIIAIILFKRWLKRHDERVRGNALFEGFRDGQEALDDYLGREEE